MLKHSNIIFPIARNMDMFVTFPSVPSMVSNEIWEGEEGGRQIDTYVCELHIFHFGETTFAT